MAGPAFQQIGNRFGGLASTFGTSNFGTGPFGGDEYTPFELPSLNLGSDDLTKTNRKKIGEVTHLLDGLIVSRRKRGERYFWKCVFYAITESEMQSLASYFELRQFNLLPDGNPDGAVIIVNWVEADFVAQSLRANLFSTEFNLESSP
jgi:hypothetical protein